MNTDKIHILITGDISTWNIDDFSINKIDNEILDIIKDADFFISNLEGPILYKNVKYKLEIRTNSIINFFYKMLLKLTGKIQPFVYSNKNILNLLKVNKNTLITLANNHIKDGGKEGFLQTLNILEKNEINYIGAEYNREEANHIFNINDEICVINVNLISAKKYHIPFFIYNSTSKDYGASYLDFKQINDKVLHLQSLDKKVILILHTGNEISSSNDELSVDFRKIKEIGANYTIIHHPHKYVKTEFEQDNIYVLGDFIFNRPGYFKSERETAILNLKISKDNIDFNLITNKVNDIYAY